MAKVRGGGKRVPRTRMVGATDGGAVVRPGASVMATPPEAGCVVVRCGSTWRPTHPRTVRSAHSDRVRAHRGSPGQTVEDRSRPIHRSETVSYGRGTGATRRCSSRLPPADATLA